MKKSYVALAFYHLIPVEDPTGEVKKHKAFFKEKDIKCRIYLSHEGINGQMSGAKEDIDEYKKFLTQDFRFSTVVFKEDPVSENIFPRVTVKVRKQLVAFDREIDLSVRGKHLSPQQWKEELESKEPCLLIDVRNGYESEIGHFENALKPEAATFREFGDYADRLKENHDPNKTKIMMYCTGGIRCEYYSAYMKKIGFDQVYQLEGGVINYNHKIGSDHWKGKLFVFDDRLAASMGEESLPISHCTYCNIPSDTYYNCANMDCNNLFLSCFSCAESMKGCCSESCMQAPRVRPFEASKGNKPFCRKHLIGKDT